MNPRTVIRKLTNEPAYFFGRFYTVRKAYGLAKRYHTDSGELKPGKEIFNFDVETSVNELEQNAVAFGIDLPASYVEGIRSFAEKQPLQRWNGGPLFNFSDVSHGYVDQKAVAIAEVQNKAACPMLEDIARSPMLLETVKKYLGYDHLRYEIKLFWTFAGQISEEERIKNSQTIEYHFDVHSWNFCYLHVYLTDCDEQSGAHQLVKGSHKNKPFKWLLRSAKQSDEMIDSYYDPDCILTIVGKAGTGFLEDTSCLHRALAPRNKDRLLLQVRYY